MKNKVYLVGAGPGDYGLITVKAMSLIEGAEVLVYDRLINESLIDRAPADCEKIYVGKAAANHALPQDEINELLYRKAAEGKNVVRLKGGDPYVFGRGGEEGLYLKEQGIDIEVVPGITSAVAGPCYAGIPVTHRDWASSFHVFTGNFKDEVHGLDFDTIAKVEGTLLFLMGFANLPYIVSGLVKAGKSAGTPVAVISNGTTKRQKTAVGTLADIEAKVAEAKLTTPALTVVGSVVNCREQLNFFEDQKKKGVLILRDSKQSDIFARKLSRAGLDPIAFPVIRIAGRSLAGDIKTALDDIAAYHWLIFTSPNGVKYFFQLFKENGGDFRALAHCKFAVIGKATGEVLQEQGFTADYIPDKQISQSLATGLAGQLRGGEEILLPRSAIAENQMVEILGAKARITDLKIYDTMIAKENQEALTGLLQGDFVDYIPFTSASTVDGLMEALAGNKQALETVKLISIGPVTTKRMERHGLRVYKEAEEHSLDGIINVLEAETC